MPYTKKMETHCDYALKSLNDSIEHLEKALYDLNWQDTKEESEIIMRVIKMLEDKREATQEQVELNKKAKKFLRELSKSSAIYD